MPFESVLHCPRPDVRPQDVPHLVLDLAKPVPKQLNRCASVHKNGVRLQPLPASLATSVEHERDWTGCGFGVGRHPSHSEDRPSKPMHLSREPSQSCTSQDLYHRQYPLVVHHDDWVHSVSRHSRWSQGRAVVPSPAVLDPPSTNGCHALAREGSQGVMLGVGCRCSEQHRQEYHAHHHRSPAFEGGTF